MIYTELCMKLSAKILKFVALYICLAAPLHAQDQAEIAFWKTVSKSGSIAQLQTYVDAYPEGVFLPLAEIKINEIQRSTGVADQTNNTSAQEECDRLAGHAGDETLPVSATSIAQLMEHAGDAIVACTAAGENSDNPRYDFQLGRAYWASGDAINAWNWYLKASLNGHQRATYRLALTLYNGNSAASQDLPKFPVAINVLEALEKFRENADRGHALSAFYAGWILAMGEVSDTSDLEAALPYLQQSEQAGVTDGLTLLGYFYEKGLHVPASYDQAVDFYRRAVHAKAKLWPNARIGLIRLLLYRLANPDYSSSEPRANTRDEALELMAAYHPDDDIYLHNAYVRLIVEEAVRKSGSISTWVALSAKRRAPLSEYDPNLGVEGRMSDLDQLLERLEPALRARRNAFPDQAPDDTEAQTQARIVAFSEALKAQIFAKFDYEQFVHHIRNHSARNCVANSRDVIGNSMRTSIRNLCDYDVIIRLRHRVEYDGDSTDQSEEFEAIIRPEQSDVFSTRVQYPASAKRGHADLMVCFAQQGFNEIESFSLPDRNANHYCSIDFIDASDEREAKIEAEIRRLTVELIGPPAN